MTDCNLRFVVTIPIHMEAMKVRRKVREHPHNREPAKNIYKIGKLEEGNPNQKKSSGLFCIIMVHDNSNLRVRHQRLYLIGKLADEGSVIMNGNIRYDIDREIFVFL